MLGHAKLAKQMGGPLSSDLNAFPFSSSGSFLNSKQHDGLIQSSTWLNGLTYLWFGPLSLYDQADFLSGSRRAPILGRLENTDSSIRFGEDTRYTKRVNTPNCFCNEAKSISTQNELVQAVQGTI